MLRMEPASKQKTLMFHWNLHMHSLKVMSNNIFIILCMKQSSLMWNSFPVASLPLFREFKFWSISDFWNCRIGMISVRRIRVAWPWLKLKTKYKSFCLAFPASAVPSTAPWYLHAFLHLMGIASNSRNHRIPLDFLLSFSSKVKLLASWLWHQHSGLSCHLWYQKPTCESQSKS